MDEKRLTLDIELGSRAVRGALAAALLLGTASELSSESLTLTTYYPAPSAVYGSILSGQATLATGANSAVVVGGTTAPGGGYLAVTKLAVINGTMGIGTTNPLYELDVAGRQTFGNVTSYTSARGLSWHVESAWTNGTLNYAVAREPGAWASPYPNLAIDFHTGVRLKAHSDFGGVQFWEGGCDNEACTTAWNGYGNAIAAFRANYAGGTYVKTKLGLGGTTGATGVVDVGGDGVAIFRQGAARCYTVTYALTGTITQLCRTGTEYLTNQSGVMGRIAAAYSGGAGSALCCQCPIPTGGGAPSCPAIP